MKLVDNWKSLWKSFSLWAMAVSTGTLLFWPTLPDDFTKALPDGTVSYVAVGVLVLGIIGRGVDQGLSTPKNEG